MALSNSLAPAAHDTALMLELLLLSISNASDALAGEGQEWMHKDTTQMRFEINDDILYGYDSCYERRLFPSIVLHPSCNEGI